PEGSSYGRDMYYFPMVPFMTLDLMGLDIEAQTNWYVESAFALIYTTGVAKMQDGYGNANYILFPFGDVAVPTTDTYVNTFYLADFMLWMAIKHPGDVVGKCARQ